VLFAEVHESGIGHARDLWLPPPESLLAEVLRKRRCVVSDRGPCPFQTSDGNASPGLRVRDLAPETGLGQNHCRGKLNGWQ
jgi:hypothetical protein